MAKTKPAAVPPTLTASSREALEERRNGKVVIAPSGERYRIRQLNLERHALSGGLPAVLVQIAMEGQAAIGKMFTQIGAGETVNGEEAAAVRDYLDELVVASVIEPRLTKDDLGDPTDLKSDALVPPNDYVFLVSVALREVDYDETGERIWGIEPLSRFPDVPDEPGGAESGAGGV